VRISLDECRRVADDAFMRFVWCVAMIVGAFVGVAEAGDKATEKATEQTPETGSGSGSAEQPDLLATLPRIDGPKLVDLGHGTKLALPAGMSLFEREAAVKIEYEWGNSGEGLVALIMGTGASWVVRIQAWDIGYVNDDDADELDANELLESYREGTTHQNIERKRRGIPELTIDGWKAVPSYDRATHRLLWGMNLHDTDGPFVTYQTRLLARNGYVSFDVSDAPEKLDTARTATKPILDAIDIQAGYRYGDHQSGDKDSGIGLKALIVGGTGIAVAKKTGLLVVILAFLKKAGIVIGGAIAGAWRWLWGRKKKQPEVVLSDEAIAQGEPPPEADVPKPPDAA
jgi:uncharacterized membrane-anchored protein